MCVRPSNSRRATDVVTGSARADHPAQRYLRVPWYGRQARRDDGRHARRAASASLARDVAATRRAHENQSDQRRRVRQPGSRDWQTSCRSPPSERNAKRFLAGSEFWSGAWMPSADRLRVANGDGKLSSGTEKDPVPMAPKRGGQEYSERRFPGVGRNGGRPRQLPVQRGDDRVTIFVRRSRFDRSSNQPAPGRSSENGRTFDTMVAFSAFSGIMRLVTLQTVAVEALWQFVATFNAHDLAVGKHVAKPLSVLSVCPDVILRLPWSESSGNPLLSRYGQFRTVFFRTDVYKT